MRPIFPVLIALFCATILVFVSCRGGRVRPEGLPDLEPCTLTVVQEGVPVEGAMVSLRSTEPGFRWSVGGLTDAQGVARIKTNGFFEGIPVGQYKVVVRKNISEGPPVPEFFTGTEEEQHAQAVAIEAQTKHFSVIAKQYTKPGTTTLEFEAKSGTNAQTFDLGKAVKDQIK